MNLHFTEEEAAFICYFNIQSSFFALLKIYAAGKMVTLSLSKDV